jgi:hypothetical protein
VSYPSLIWIPRLALFAGLALHSAAPLPAQSTTPRVLQGRVVKHGEPVGGAEVTLHRVTRSASGPMARRTSGSDGGFRFELPPAQDTSGFTVYFTTAEYEGVRYFGAPLHAGDPVGPYQLQVYDTTSSLADSVLTARRDAVFVPGNDGGWEVNEVMRIANLAGRTLVPRDGIRSWELPLPAGATDFEAGEGEVAPDQLRLVGDRVLLLAPLVPGQHEIFLRYRLTAGAEATTLPLSGRTDTLNLYVRQPAPRVTVEGLESTRSVEVQGESFIQYGGTDLPATTRISLSFAASGGVPLNPVYAGVGAAVLLLLLGTWVALRQRPGDSAPMATSAGSGA